MCYPYPAVGQNPGPAVPGRRRAVLGRTHSLPTRLLENWTARTCTGFLVLRVRVIHYPELGTPEHTEPQPAAAVTNSYRPGRDRPRHK